jgi:hypothetical protein
MRNKIEPSRWYPVGLALVLSLGAQPVAAEPVAAEPVAVPGGLVVGEVHGFASQGFLLTTGNEYLVEDSTQGSFQLSEVGINYTRELTDKLRFGLQLFAQNFGQAGSYTPQVDWFYLDYHYRDWLGLRAGRLKLPYGLFNEVNDIESARVPILLPQSVYPQQARSFLFAFTGAELYGFARSPGAGALEYRLYGGTVHLDPRLVVPVGTPAALAFNVPYAFGGRLTWETPLSGLRLGGTFLQLHLDTLAFIPMVMDPVSIENDSYTWLASLEYGLGALTLMAEYGQGHSDQRSVLPGNTLEVTGDGGYVMLNYVASPWFQSAVYYSLKFNDVDNRDGLDNQQHDVSLTLRFDINSFWLVKLEGHYMAGTAGLVNPLRFGPPPADPARHWGVFLVKTTAYF